MRSVIVAIDCGHYVKTSGVTSGASGRYKDKKGKWHDVREYDVVNGVGAALEQALVGKVEVVSNLVTLYKMLYGEFPKMPRKPVKDPKFEKLYKEKGIGTSIYARLKAVGATLRKQREAFVAFVSIHANAGGGRGTEVFYGSENIKSRELANALLTAILSCARSRFDWSWRQHGVKGIKTELDVPKSERSRLSILFKETAADAGMAPEDYESRLYHVLVELGFLDTQEDAIVLANPDFQREVGKAMAGAILSWARSMPEPYYTPSFEKIMSLYK